VTTPLLLMNPFCVRNTRWNWVDTAFATETTPHLEAQAVDPGHPVFKDVPLMALGPGGPAHVVQVIDPFVGTGLTSFIGTDDMGNGRLIARPVGLGMGWIAEWEAGVEFYEGAGQFAGGKRMLFCAGTQEVGGTPKGEFNLTAEGRQMFRNAITYLLGGADIILVTEDRDWNLDGLRDDHDLEMLLVSEGHFVDVRPNYWRELGPDKIAQLNAADLILFSRATNSASYDDGDEPSQWNSLTTPLLQMNAYCARNSRWEWVNSGTATGDTPAIYLEAVAPSHPIFSNVVLIAPDADDGDDPATVVRMIDPNVGSGITSFIDTTDMGNGRLLAKPVAWQMGWIAEWDAGVEFYEGAGQYAGATRLLFSAGTQEIQFTDPDTQELMTTTQGELNLTTEGLQMFRNAIAYLLRPEPTGSTFGIYRLDTGELVLSDQDMAAYVGATHEIELNESGLAKWESYTADGRWYDPDGLYQKEFAVRIDDREIYRGRFWSGWSSMSCGGAVILEMPFPREGAQGTIRIQYGYPGTAGDGRGDPRGHPEIIDFFAGKGILK